MIDENQYNGVDKENAEYESMEEGLNLVDDLRQGTAKLREMHEVYLPKFESEKPENYKRRWSSATLHNAFEETVGMLVGKAFAKPPGLDDDVPLEIKGDDNNIGLIEDIDRQGNHFQVFAENLFKCGLRSGLSHILIDSTPLPEGTVTEAEKKVAGHRPYWIHFQAKDVFAWSSEIVDGKQTLVQVRIRQKVVAKEGEFDSKLIDQILVLDIGRARTFRKAEESDSNSWTLHEERPMIGFDGTPLTYIPLVTFYADEDNGFMTSIPPLLDLAYKNIEHFQVHSDYRNCLTVAMFPIFCISGWQGDENSGTIALGPTTTVKLSDPSAKAYFAEHSGAALNAGRQFLSDLKEEMGMYGLRMLLPKPGQSPTATGEAISEAKTSSQLQVAVLRLKDALELALDYTARWLGLGDDAGGSVTVDNASLTLSLQDIDEILKAAGAPSKPVIDTETAIDELKRRGVLGDDVDPKEVLARMNNQALQSSPIGGLAGSFLRAPNQNNNSFINPNPTNNQTVQ